MPFKILTRLHEEGSWDPVIDMKKSKSTKVVRIFMNEDEVESFVEKSLKKEMDNPNIKIEELE
jgi:hypothetical protein